MSKTILIKKYEAQDIDVVGALEDDIEEAIQKEIKGGMNFRGYIKVTVQYVSPEDCECTGFQHDRDCHNWVMSF